jgi:hypothetical protein
MKKLIIASLLLLLCAMPALAKTDITIPPTFSQDDFKNFSRDMGLAISYVPLAPAEPLGDKLPGFDIGVEVTGIKLDKNATYWKKVEAVMGDTIPSTLPVPKVHAQIGFPFIPIDIGFVYTKVPSTNIKYMGGEIKYAFLEGGVATPAIAIRGAYTKLSGVEDLDLSTKYLDLSISKGIAMVTPYAGYAMVWIDSKETSNDPAVIALNLQDVSTTEGKAFVGAKITFFPLMNMVVEADFAKVPSYSLRLNLSF